MKEQGRLHDGSANYGNGVIGPSTYDQDLFRDPLKKPLKNTGASSTHISGGVISSVTVGTALAITGAAAEGAINPSDVEAADNEKTSLTFDFPWPEGEERRLTGGPHNDNKKPGILGVTDPRDGLDFAARKKISCDNSPNKTVKRLRITAPQSGTVSKIGKGIVKIDHEDDYTSVLIHIGDVKVAEGQDVIQGEDIGAMSCITPDTGSTTGLNTHFAVWQNGKRIDATRIDFEDGWEAFEKPKNYYGGLRRRDEKIVASISTCNESNPRDCSNVIYNEPNANSPVQSDPQPTAVPSPEPPTFDDMDFGEEHTLPEFVPANEDEKVKYEFAKAILDFMEQKQSFQYTREHHDRSGNYVDYRKRGVLKGSFELTPNKKEELIRKLASGGLVRNDPPIRYNWSYTETDTNTKTKKKDWAKKEVGTAIFDGISIFGYDESDAGDRASGVKWWGDLELHVAWRRAALIDRIGGCEVAYAVCEGFATNKEVNNFLKAMDEEELPALSGWSEAQVKVPTIFVHEDGVVNIITPTPDKFRTDELIDIHDLFGIRESQRGSSVVTTYK